MTAYPKASSGAAAPSFSFALRRHRVADGDDAAPVPLAAWSLLQHCRSSSRAGSAIFHLVGRLPSIPPAARALESAVELPPARTTDWERRHRARERCRSVACGAGAHVPLVSSSQSHPQATPRTASPFQVPSGAAAIHLRISCARLRRRCPGDMAGPGEAPPVWRSLEKRATVPLAALMPFAFAGAAFLVACRACAEAQLPMQSSPGSRQVRVTLCRVGKSLCLPTAAAPFGDTTCAAALHPDRAISTDANTGCCSRSVARRNGDFRRFRVVRCLMRPPATAPDFACPDVHAAFAWRVFLVSDGVCPLLPVISLHLAACSRGGPMLTREPS